MYKKIILICGMPRSGTSWLGQIFDSSPDVAFRMEPLFSYSFKNIINESSSSESIEKFFSDVYVIEDDFINQKENRRSGAYDSFSKNTILDYLVVKTTRHHNLLERYLQSLDRLEVVSIIRHPCAVVNSWINTDREFNAKGCTVENDWRSGNCRKDGEGEFWGFDDWLSVTKMHVDLGQRYSNFHILKYSQMIHDLENVIDALFARLSIPLTNNTINFLRECNSRHVDDPYSVFKNISVEDKWKTTLDKSIAIEIESETIATGMGDLLV